MRTILSISIALALAGSAAAGTNKGTGEVCQGSDCSPGAAPVDVTVTASPSVSQSNRQSNAQSVRVGPQSTRVTVGGQSVEVGDQRTYVGGQRATTGDQDQNVSQSVTVSNPGRVEYSGSYRVKNVPSAMAPSIDPTVPCAVPVSGAGSGVGFGFSVGSAYIDKGCEQRELIRLGLTSGNPAAEDKAAALLNQELDNALRASESPQEPAESVWEAYPTL